jgi:hypothetical protein
VYSTNHLIRISPFRLELVKSSRSDEHLFHPVGSTEIADSFAICGDLVVSVRSDAGGTIAQWQGRMRGRDVALHESHVEEAELVTDPCSPLQDTTQIIPPASNR